MCFATWLAVPSFGCGGSQPAPATSSGGSAPPPAAPASAAPSADGAGGSADAQPTATVRTVNVMSKADHYTRVSIGFSNPSKAKCKITSYTLSWDGGSKTIPLDDMMLGPGESQVRAVKVHWGEGDITRLSDPSAAHVDVKSTCGQ